MEEHKTQPVEASAVADPIRERAETPHYDPHKQSSVKTDRPRQPLPIGSAGTAPAHATAIRTSPCGWLCAQFDANAWSTAS